MVSLFWKQGRQQHSVCTGIYGTWFSLCGGIVKRWKSCSVQSLRFYCTSEEAWDHTAWEYRSIPNNAISAWCSWIIYRFSWKIDYWGKIIAGRNDRQCSIQDIRWKWLAGRSRKGRYISRCAFQIVWQRVGKRLRLWNGHRWTQKHLFFWECYRCGVICWPAPGTQRLQTGFHGRCKALCGNRNHEKICNTAGEYLSLHR